MCYCTWKFFCQNLDYHTLTYQKTEENTFKSRMKSTCNMYLILVAHLPKQNQQFLVKADFLARIWKVGLKLKRTKNVNAHIIAMISHNKKTKIWHCIQRISQASPVQRGIKLTKESCQLEITLINTIILNLLKLTYLNKWIVEQICNTMKNKVEILQGHKMIPVQWLHYICNLHNRRQ